MDSEELAFEYLSKKYGCSFSYEVIARNPIWQSEFYAYIRGFETCESKLKCCGNCRHKTDELVKTCKLLKNYTLVEGCCDKWEVKE